MLKISINIYPRCSGKTSEILCKSTSNDCIILPDHNFGSSFKTCAHIIHGVSRKNILSGLVGTHYDTIYIDEFTKQTDLLFILGALESYGVKHVALYATFKNQKQWNSIHQMIQDVTISEFEELPKETKMFEGMEPEWNAKITSAELSYNELLKKKQDLEEIIKPKLKEFDKLVSKMYMDTYYEAHYIHLFDNFYALKLPVEDATLIISNNWFKRLFWCGDIKASLSDYEKVIDYLSKKDETKKKEELRSEVMQLENMTNPRVVKAKRICPTCHKKLGKSGYYCASCGTKIIYSV